MKWLSLIILLFLLSGCAMLGTNMIHSPISSEGTPWKTRHVHGGPTKKTPPNAILFNVNDSVNLVVGARTIWEKTNFGGILLPIFPVFWTPKIDHYKGQQNSLIIEVSTLYDIKEFEIISASVNTNGQAYELKKIIDTTDSKELTFSLSAEQTLEFELTNLTVKIDSEIIELSTIRFKKVKQRWRFIGP